MPYATFPINHRASWIMVIFILGLLLSFSPISAQTSGKFYRIGWLGPTYLGETWFMPKPFLEELQKLGWVEGQHFIMEFRPPGEQFFEDLSTFAAELIRFPVDVIVTAATPAALTAKRMTDTIPIVMAGNSRPVQRGLIASLAQPGGNVTGLTNGPGGDWNWPGKRMELLKETVPKIARVGILSSSLKAKRMSPEQVQAYVSRWQRTAQSIGLTVVPVIVYRAEDYPQAFATLTQRQVDALYVHANAQNVKHEQLIVDFASEKELPTMFGVRTSVEAGGLMSYALDWDGLRRRTAHYVDKILKGAKPADLPVEEPSKIELVINLKTAKAFGLSIPPSILIRADKVIR